MKIELDDDRIVVGRFRCTDDASNIVLSDAYEIRNQMLLGGENKKGTVAFLFIALNSLFNLCFVRSFVCHVTPMMYVFVQSFIESA